MSALGNVIAALATRQTRGTTRKHVPYRDSKLTRLLEDSLGGNCRTTMLATISPAAESIAETLSTLKFAMRAKRVTNVPRLNEDLDQASLLRKYERELRRLRAKLEERNRNVVDQRCLLELEERRRRAEKNKHGGRRRPHLVAWRSSPSGRPRPHKGDRKKWNQKRKITPRDGFKTYT